MTTLRAEGKAVGWAIWKGLLVMGALLAASVMVAIPVILAGLAVGWLTNNGILAAVLGPIVGMWVLVSVAIWAGSR